MMIKLLILLGLFDGTVLTQAPTGSCEDIDSQSCKRLHAAKPDLCNDRTFYDSICKRFCGNCPLQCYSCPQAVLNPSDCTKTETCGINTMCATKTLRAKDGHHEYLMKCEDTEMCDLIIGGFGKRDTEDVDTSSRKDHAMIERDVTLDCCDRDLCNDGIQTTATPITTSIKPKPTTNHIGTTTPHKPITRPPTQPSPCVDTIDNCGDYVNGMCTKPEYHDWIETHCKAFCKEHFCTPEQIRAYENTTTTIAPELCFDHVDCRLYGDGQSQCVGEFSPWARKNCPLSCGFCKGTTTPPQPCVDKVPNCDEYVKTMCTDPAYTLWREDHCRKFCSLC